MYIKKIIKIFKEKNDIDLLILVLVGIWVLFMIIFY